jgi:holliday junction DNA helicase RuvA
VIESAQPRVSPAPAPNAGAQAGALSALGNLGYAPAEAAAAVAEAAGAAPEATEATTEAELIRDALKLLAPKG